MLPALPSQILAQAIVDLINSRPTSPRAEEIAAILRGAAPAGQAHRVTIFPDQLALRELIAEKERMEAPESGATEEPCASLAGRASAIQESVWATPARTLVDVLFRAEISAFQADETMGSLNDEDAYDNDRAVAQPIRAAVDVLRPLRQGVVLCRDI